MKKTLITCFLSHKLQLSFSHLISFKKEFLKENQYQYVEHLCAWRDQHAFLMMFNFIRERHAPLTNILPSIHYISAKISFCCPRHCLELEISSALFIVMLLKAHIIVHSSLTLNFFSNIKNFLP